MTPDIWKLVASIGGVLVTVVTGPIIWAMRTEAGKIRTEMALLRAEIKLDLVEMEKRINERIDTRLVHR